MFNRSDFISDSDWNRFIDFSKDLETPNIVINLHQIKQNYIKLKIPLHRQRKPSTERKGNIYNGRKYLQITCMVKGLMSKYKKNI